MAEFASNAKGNAALATGIIGTAGVGLGLLNGGLGNILGGWGCNNNRGVASDAAAMAAMTAAIAANAPHTPVCGCSEDHLINRYEAAQQARIAELETEVKLRDANTYTDQKILATYQYIDGELKEIRNNLCAQAVMNQKTADSFEMVKNDIICVKNELYSAISRERDERRCGDNAIVNYANATFYPKQVADVTTGDTTTAQMLYNPLPRCGCKCGNG